MSYPAGPTPVSPVRAHPRRWWILGVLCLSVLAVTIDNTVLNVAIPSLVTDLRATTSDVQWVVDAYSLVFAGLLLTAGAMSDRTGRRRGLLVGLVLFGLGSLGASMAAGTGQLIAARGLMGVGGAFLMPGTLSILVNVFDESERMKAIGIWSGVSGLGVAGGPVLGGLLVEHFWWGSVFLVNVPVVLLAVAAVLWLVPESRNPAAGRPDVPGALLSTVAMVAAVWSLIGAPAHGWLSARTLGGLALAGTAGAVFVMWERRTDAPMIDLALLRHRRYAGASSVGMLLMFALGGALFLLTQYLQLVLGYGPLEAGLRAVPAALAVALVAPLSAGVSARLGASRAIAAGMVVVAAGLAVLATLGPASGYGVVVTGLVLVGAGIGLATAPAAEAVLSAMPQEQAGVASALNDTVQETGTSLGVAVLGSVLAASFSGRLEPGASTAVREAFSTAMDRGLLVGAGVALVGAVVGWVALRPADGAAADGAAASGAPAGAGVADGAPTARGVVGGAAADPVAVEVAREPAGVVPV